jgi:hypothetical protein
MTQRFLEITYRRGRAVAAYLYLPRKADDKSARTERMDGGLLLDYADDGRPIGVEITAPGKFAISALNAALNVAGAEPVAPDEVAPLLRLGQTPAA